LTVIEPEDDRLLERAAAGDEEAFRLLVRRWEGALLAFLERMTGSREEAEDLAQETFLRAFRNAKRYRSRGRFKSWLFRIAGNLTRSRLRRRKIVAWVRFDPGAHDVPGDEPPPDRALEGEERRRAVRAALMELPERQREAVVLRRWEEMSVREIAETMGTTEPAVDSLLHRAIVTLRRTLAPGEETR
jgi:RNA polymerase sigma-70 factor (ECF subfamily)